MMSPASPSDALLTHLTGRPPLPFVRFMDLALYDPQVGYYMVQRPRLGRQGDFVTAPEMTSLFGEMLAIQFVLLWQAMGSPDSFTLVEGGAGSGKLAADILSTAQAFPDFARTLRYQIIERSPDFAAIQQETLAPFADRCAWFADIRDLPPIRGVLFSNELLDALPVHWVEQTPDGLMEVAVTLDGDGGLATTLIPPQAPLTADYFTSRGILLPPGTRTEVGLMGQDWMGQAARRLAQGAIVTIDYGYPAREYYHPGRSQGTLVGHHRHERIDDPLQYPGDMDLTAHVDFSALARVGEEMGLTTLGFTTLNWFLMSLGLLQRIEPIIAGAPDSALSVSLKQTAMRLLMPGGMGERFRVLAQGKGLDPTPPAGFSMRNSLDVL